MRDMNALLLSRVGCHATWPFSGTPPLLRGATNLYQLQQPATAAPRKHF